MKKTINWLLKGDICIIFMTMKYLLGCENNELIKEQKLIEEQGYAKIFLSLRNQNGLWGKYYYQPKWTSTHYTLLDLKNMEISSNNEVCKMAVLSILDNCMLNNGGFNLSKSKIPNDICIDGMILNYCSYFLIEDERLKRTVDLLISAQKADGGFVQYTNIFTDAHATICVLEGLLEFRKNSNYRSDELLKVEKKALYYFYQHNLFLDKKDNLKIYYPFRYYYTIVRFLNYCIDANIEKNQFIEKALHWLHSKQNNEGLWNLEGVYQGVVHCDLEEIKKPSRFITLMSLKILKGYHYVI